jgi:hypothetical protein
MWDLRPLTTLWASATRYGDNFTYNNNNNNNNRNKRSVQLRYYAASALISCVSAVRVTVTSTAVTLSRMPIPKEASHESDGPQGTPQLSPAVVPAGSPQPNRIAN